MQTKQTVVGLTRRFFAISPWLLLIYAVITIGLSVFSHSHTAFAACATGVQGVQGNTAHPDVNKCYDQTTNAVVGDATGTPATPANGTAGQSPANSTDGKSATCAIERIGWILCPIISSSAKISDKAFQMLANNFLNTEPELVANGSGTQTAWEDARNIANIMFIIAFLIIIVAQVTNYGISNYGVKKMLPRLVVGAILVNLSFFICQLAVDLTNILGYEIQKTLVDIANKLGPSVLGDVQNYGSGATTGSAGLDGNTILTAIAAAALGAVAIWAIVAQLGAICMFVLVTALVIIVILLLRKALIVLLVVLSPIAFVMYLLPNTEQYFRKWLKMFWQLLMVFPVVGLLFGAGQLASTIIIVSGAQDQGAAATAQSCNSQNNTTVRQYNKTQTTSNPDSYNTCGGGSVNLTTTADGTSAPTRTVSWTLGLVATGIAIAPLMAVWAVLKGALSAAGAIGGKISGAVQSASNRIGQGAATPAGWAKKRAGENLNRRWQNAQARGIDENGRPTSLAGRFGIRRARRSEMDRLSKEDLERRQRRALDQQLSGTGSGELVSGLAGGGGDAIRAAQARRTAEENKRQSEEMETGRLAVRNLDADAVNAQALAGIRSGDTNNATVAAAIERAMKVGSADQKAAIVDALRGTGASLASRTAAASLSADNPGYFGAATIDNISRGAATGSYQEMALQGITEGRFNADKMASANRSDSEYARRISAGNAAALDHLAREATEALTGETTKGRIGNQRAELEAMRRPRP